jgi:uncharacterized repeat protein (TIGR03803 family)
MRTASGTAKTLLAAWTRTLTACREWPALPYAGLTAVNGVLYGVTYGGDGNDNGTIFEVNTSGVERVLYNFKGGTDGANPYADLIAANGVLYGTTARGGANNAGTVFEVSKAGVESVLHSFGSGTDGSIPYGRLADVNGALYGTTAAGGASGYGTVFAVSASGAERVLHSFQGSPDGAVPYAGLVFGSSVTATHSRAVRPSTSSAVLDRGAIPRSRRVPASVARTIPCSVRRVVPRGAMHHGDRQVGHFVCRTSIFALISAHRRVLISACCLALAPSISLTTPRKRHSRIAL